MRKGEVQIINELGLHARAAAQLLRLSESFQSDIKLIRTDSGVYANAKSILSILTLAASRGTLLELEVNGNDEDSAYEKIVEIFRCGFGEL